MSELEIIIERRVFDPTCFDPATIWNNNNLEKDPSDPEYDQIKDLDKDLVHKQTWFHRFVDLLEQKPLIFQLTESERQTLQDAAKIGRLTTRRPVIVEGLEDIEARLEREIPFNGGEMYFIRTDSSSPKDGTPGMPATSACGALDTLSTSHRAYTAFQSGCKTLYFMPWDDTMNTKLELRVFVHKRRVCAISQYDCYSPCIFNEYSDLDLKRLGNRVITFCEAIADKINQDSMVVDIGIQPLLDKQNPPIRLIELNSFGYWMCSGAGCFNWITDREKLYGRLGKKVFFRIVNG